MDKGLSDNGQRHFHFLGICGTAMGAVASALRARGFTVTGSDENVYPPMSTFLEQQGIELFSGFRAENLPVGADVMVVGNAIKRGNPEVEAVLDRKLLYLSMPEVLKEVFLRGKHNLVVSGTHGKTTCTSMLAHLLESAGKSPDFLIGGIPENLGCGARISDSPYSVIEGDEYDTAFFDKRSKFLHYLPELLIINNLEFDHADIFRDLDDIKLSFRRLVNIVPSNGVILFNGDDENCMDVVSASFAPAMSVGFGAACMHRITDAAYSAQGSEFTLLGVRFLLPQAGEFNIRNAAMALVAAHFQGVEMAGLVEGMKAFRGVRRRQEVRGAANGVTIIDDFGHHPTAISQTLQALRHVYPGRKLWAVFEPRSNTTRRAVFQESLPVALAHADEVVLAQVARLDQLAVHERLNPEKVVESIRSAGKAAHYDADVASIVERIARDARPSDVVCIFSNGGFDGIHNRLLSALGGSGQEQQAATPPAGVENV